MRTLILIFVLLATAFRCSAQTVYSAGVYSMGQTHEVDWTIGSGSARFGFDQYRQYQDASGRNLYDFTEVSTKAVASPRFTTVFLGPFRFTLRGPAWFAVSLAAVMLASVFLLIAVRVARVRRSHTHARNTASSGTRHANRG